MSITKAKVTRKTPLERPDPIESVTLTLTPVQAMLLAKLLGRLPELDWDQPIYDALKAVGFNSLLLSDRHADFHVRQVKVDLGAVKTLVEAL